MNRCIQSMPARPLLWLTIFFMAGISAARLFGENLPAQSYYFAFAALVLTSAMAVTLWLRVRTAQFAIPALLFAIFGIWAAQSAAPQFPQDLEPFLNGRQVTYVAEVSTSTTIRASSRELSHSRIQSHLQRAIYFATSVTYS